MGLEQRRLKEHNADQKHPHSLQTQPLNFSQLRAWRVRRNTSIRLAALYVLIVILSALAGDAIDRKLPSGQYFSDKSNFFNRFFVKFGWAWTNLAFFACSYIGSRLPPLRDTGPPARLEDRRSRTRVSVIGDDAARFARYTVATGYWYAMTQWCWGPPLIDRLFAATGGTCSVPSLTYSIECKRAGGQWEGGHDASGHRMMLIHATLFLWEEVIAGGFVPFGSCTTDKDGKDLGGMGLGAKIRAKVGRPGCLSSSFAAAICILWTFMLMTTALFFHPLEEKISGTILGILGWAGTYRIAYPHFEFPGMPVRE